MFSGWDGILPLPWLPDALILYGVPQTSDGYLSHANFAGYTGDTAISIGIADRITGNQQCIAINSNQMFFPPDNLSRRWAFNDRCFVSQRTGAASLPANYLVITEWDRCGITFTPHGTSSYRLFYTAIGGVTLNTASGILNLPSDGSNGVASGLSFDPSAAPSMLLGLSIFGNDDNGHGLLSIGAADSNLNERAHFWAINYNARGGRAEAGSALVHFSPYEANLASFNSGGFTISQGSAYGAEVPLLWLLLSDVDGNFSVGSTNWPTGTESVTTPGFQGEGIITWAGINGEEPIGGQITLGSMGGKFFSIFLENHGISAGVADVDDQRRWTTQQSLSVNLQDYIGNTGSFQSGTFVDFFTSSGFDWESGGPSGFAFDPAYVDFFTSPVAPISVCGQGLIGFSGCRLPRPMVSRLH